MKTITNLNKIINKYTKKKNDYRKYMKIFLVSLKIACKKN